MITKPFKPFLSLITIGCSVLNADAQKLPNVQAKSLRAPANIKIDGKATEWNDRFQAYNHAIVAYYTLSNDDRNLYLTVQSPDRAVINKILSGGLTFTAQRSGKKTDKDGISITYPIFDKKATPFVPQALSAAGQSGDMITTADGGGSAAPAVKLLKGDSLMQVFNKDLERSKEIGVRGIKTLDTLISAYNSEGIRVAEAFDNKICYTYELAIDLKLLGLSVSEGPKFAYHIVLNGENPFAPHDADPKRATGGLGVVMLDDAGVRSSTPTDMWGEYTLAKPGQ